jgi:hypothetical protein
MPGEKIPRSRRKSLERTEVGYVLRGLRGGKWGLTEVCYGAILSDLGVKIPWYKAEDSNS